MFQVHSRHLAGWMLTNYMDNEGHATAFSHFWNILAWNDQRNVRTCPISHVSERKLRKSNLRRLLDIRGRISKARWRNH